MSEPKRLIDREMLEDYKTEAGLDSVGLVGIGNFEAIYDRHGKEPVAAASEVIGACLGRMGISYQVVPAVERYQRGEITVNEDVWVFAIPGDVDGDSVKSEAERMLAETGATSHVGFEIAVRDESEYEMADL